MRDEAQKLEIWAKEDAEQWLASIREQGYTRAYAQVSFKKGRCHRILGPDYELERTIKIKEAGILFDKTHFASKQAVREHFDTEMLPLPRGFKVK